MTRIGLFNRLTVTFLALGLLLAMSAGCQSSRYRTSTAERRLKDERPAADRLQAVIGRVNFINEPLDSALRKTLDTVGLRHAIHWPAIEAVGVNMHTPISLQMQRVSVEQTITALLRQAQVQSSAREALDFDIVRGTVMISTRSNLARSVAYNNTYDIRAFLVNLSEYEDLPGYNSDGSKIDKSQAKDNREFSRRIALMARPAGSERQRRVEQIMRIITTTVGQPEDWTPNSPSAGSLHELNGDLIVHTLPRNHRQIDQLLRDLHESRRGARKQLGK
jgi:hypothetical protein